MKGCHEEVGWEMRLKKWGAHSEEMRSILEKCAGRSRDDWIGKKMCQQSACVSATDFLFVVLNPGSQASHWIFGAGPGS
jgi:hypothetical protein